MSSPGTKFHPEIMSESLSALMLEQLACDDQREAVKERLFPRTLSTSVLRIKHRSSFWERFFENHRRLAWVLNQSHTPSSQIPNETIPRNAQSPSIGHKKSIFLARIVFPLLYIWMQMSKSVPFFLVVYRTNIFIPSMEVILMADLRTIIMGTFRDTMMADSSYISSLLAAIEFRLFPAVRCLDDRPFQTSRTPPAAIVTAY